MFTLQQHIDKAEQYVRSSFANGNYDVPPTWIGETADGGIIPVIGFQPETIEDFTRMMDAARAAFHGFKVVQYVSIVPGYVLDNDGLREAISIAAFDVHGNSKSAVLYVLKHDHNGKQALSPIKILEFKAIGPGADLLKATQAPQSDARH